MNKLRGLIAMGTAIALIALAVLWLSGQSSGRQAADQQAAALLQSGITLFQAKEYEQAIGEFEQVPDRLAQHRRGTVEPSREATTVAAQAHHVEALARTRLERALQRAAATGYRYGYTRRRRRAHRRSSVLRRPGRCARVTRRRSPHPPRHAPRSRACAA